MKKALTTGFASVVMTALLSAPAAALTVEGVDVPDTYSAMDTELTLNGAGTRSKWFMDLYVGGLYVTEATLEGFEASTDGDMASIQEDVDQFMAVFQEEITEGDVFDLVYLPGEGVRVLKNGEHKDTVGDLAFKKALFGIWLSDKPAQEDLKEKMLGQR